MSDSLWPYRLQHARLPCPSLSPGVCSDSCSLSPWCHPTISSFVVPLSSSLNLSQHWGLFQWVGSSCQWPKNWSFSFSISPSNEYSGLISFRINWFDLLAVQGTLKTLLQHHSSKASILWHPAFFMIYDYMVMPVDIFDCQCWGWERVLLAWWVETWDAANHSTLHRRDCHNKSFSCSSFQ